MNIQLYFKKKRLIGKARVMKKACDSMQGLTEKIEFVQTFGKFSLVQQKDEFEKLIKLVSELKPKIICDIGSSGGGTVFLFSSYADPQAEIISIDIANDVVRQAAFVHLIKKTQKIQVIHDNSSHQNTIQRVKEYLGNRTIDLLFIDGDHNYEGVKKDFELYYPLVTKGGLIGFHDIVEDYKTKHGKETSTWVGEVPQYWREIKENYKTQEIIEDYQQDGFGIGVMFK